MLARSSFGTIGANVPAILRAIVACGWFGIQTYIGGEGDAHLPGCGVAGLRPRIGAATRSWVSNVPSAITFGIFWLINIGIIVFGMNAVRVFENWAHRSSCYWGCG